ncbi:hypothetical protein [Lentzea sp. NEAU-D7]|nr:hypothetical protein [Lentzea sp. NEAU-D7]MCX2948879.1 hypothetical protein [Lentzea sp. NEAU-D7]
MDRGRQLPRKSVTLRLAAQGGVDHLYTAAAYYTASYALERAYARVSW